MTTLAEIEKAVAALSREQMRALYRHLAQQLEQLEQEGVETSPPSRHGVLDITPVGLGPLLRPFDGDDDLLDEMLQERT